jgi:hypothetical protein
MDVRAVLENTFSPGTRPLFTLRFRRFADFLQMPTSAVVPKNNSDKPARATLYVRRLHASYTATTDCFMSSPNTFPSSPKNSPTTRRALRSDKLPALPSRTLSLIATSPDYEKSRQDGYKESTLKSRLRSRSWPSRPSLPHRKPRIPRPS